MGLPTNIIGLIRVRNEAHIIQDTLDHMAEFCTGGIFVYDDASTDDTPELCRSHGAVRRLIPGREWAGDVDKAPSWVKGAALHAAREVAGPEDWFVYLDADERVEFDFAFAALSPKIVAVRMKLFDFYITERDKHLSYHSRRWLGPEYRPIVMAFRNLPVFRFYAGREIQIRESDGEVLDWGHVQHYGKAIGVEAWEQKCRYYAENYPPESPRARKWAARRGKAVHTVSDFGSPLIEWHDRETKGVALTPEIERREKY